MAPMPTRGAMQGYFANTPKPPPPLEPLPTRYISSYCGMYERKALLRGLTYVHIWLLHSCFSFFYIRETLLGGLMYVCGYLIRFLSCTYGRPYPEASRTSMEILFFLFYTLSHPSFLHVFICSLFYGESPGDNYTKYLRRIYNHTFEPLQFHIRVNGLITRQFTLERTLVSTRCR
jgi:hypothetical protein